MTHLYRSRGEDSLRLFQVQQLLEWIDTWDPAVPRIVCGDFNASLDKPSAAPMATRFRPTQTAPTAFTAVADHDGSVSHPYWLRLDRGIDYIRVSPDIENGLRPMLFIYAHGASRNGICIDPSKEIIGWEKLVELLRPINVATESNLCVVSAACLSLLSIMEMGIEEPVPYFIDIAAERAFYFKEREIVGFFEDIFDGPDIVSAHERNRASGYPAAPPRQSSPM